MEPPRLHLSSLTRWTPHEVIALRQVSPRESKILEFSVLGQGVRVQEEALSKYVYKLDDNYYARTC